MANRFLCSCVRRSSLILRFSPQLSSSFRSSSHHPDLPLNFPRYQRLGLLNPWKDSWGLRHLSHGHVNLVLTQGTPKFETHKIEPPKKEKWKTKKRFKMQRKREKQKRKAANKRDPRWLGVKGKKKKQKFPNAEARIKNKIEQAKIKEALLVERLKRYEVPKLQGPTVKPEKLTGEERFYMKKMAQKRSNYVPVGRRGVFGGVILNMHLHWKKHETVKVICKPCKQGQVHEYAKEIERLSGGTPIQIIGNDTIIFYRGKNYVQPEVMSPIDTLSKKKALEKSKYEQSLESVRRFIAIAEKELELYYRHVALYGDPNSRHSNSAFTHQRKSSRNTGNSEFIKEENINSTTDGFSTYLPETEADSEIEELSGSEVDSAGEDIAESESGTDNEEYVENILETEDCTSDKEKMSGLVHSSASVLHSSMKNRSHSAFIAHRKSSSDIRKLQSVEEENANPTADGFSTDLPDAETDSEIEGLCGTEVGSAGEDIPESDIGSDNEENTGDTLETEDSTDDEESTSSLLHGSASALHSSVISRWSSDTEQLPCHRFRNS